MRRFNTIAAAPHTVTRIVVCLDGLDPAYLDSVETPAWDRIAADGSAGTCRAALPTLTNVNNVGLLTGTPPSEHGVAGNTLLDPETGEREYVRSAEYRRAETWLETESARGAEVVALFVKNKLVRLAGGGADVALSAEEPPAWLTDAVGEAPDIYSGDASAWLLDAALHLREERDPDVLYVSTTDVVPHKHAPGEDSADEWVRALDDRLGRLAADADLVATADHGMHAKTRCVDLDAVLADAGHEAEVVRLIRDAHTYHHQNLGGAAYVHVGSGGGADANGDADAGRDRGVAPATGSSGETNANAAAVLRDVEGVERAVPREDAAVEFDLPADRIGDYLVLGDAETVFGPVEDGVTADVTLRSHGSLHEERVPWVATVDASIDRNWEAWAALTA